MADAGSIAAVLEGAEAYRVGGSVRDDLLHRPVIDVDIACGEPERAARAYGAVAPGAVFLLSSRHGAWRVALLDGRTVDFTMLRGSIEEDLAGRDFTINAIAVPLGDGSPIDPFHGLADLAARVLRAVSPAVFREDPLRLLRAVRLEDELGFRLDPETEALVRRDARLVTRPAGERIVAELLRMSSDGYRRLNALGLLEPLGGSLERLEPLVRQVRTWPGVRPQAMSDAADPRPELLLIAALGPSVFELPTSNETRRMARTVLGAAAPEDDSPRAIHRFRRATEPWALEALAFLGASGLAEAVVQSRKAEPPEPLLRGDELGVPPGPEVGRLLARIAEERAAGTIETRDDALQLVKRERR